MAEEVQITWVSDEPPRDQLYEDVDGDCWYWSNGWQYGHQSVAERKMKPDSSYVSGDGRSWARVQEHFRLGFPWTQIENPIVTVPMAGSPLTDDLGDQGFVVKDSGQREEYSNGFVRDTEDGKPDLTEPLRLLYSRPDIADLITRPGFDLLPVEMMERCSDHMFKGAQKYGRDNWRQARGLVAVARFCRSLVRHVCQYISGDRTEDHAAAVTFNVWAAELTPKDDL